MRTKTSDCVVGIAGRHSRWWQSQDRKAKTFRKKKHAEQRRRAKMRHKDARRAGYAKAEADVHEFVIANFRTESGVTLPQAQVVYGTYGHLNAARDNVVLLPSHYMADHTRL